VQEMLEMAEKVWQFIIYHSKEKQREEMREMIKVFL